MKIKDRAKPKVPPVAPGAYIGICVGVINLGDQYSEKFKNYSTKVKIVFELAGQTVEVDGERKPRQLSKTFTFSSGKKSALRAFLSQWMGAELSDEQAANFELFDIIGHSAYLNVMLNETGEYANIAGIMQVPAGFPVPPAITPPIKWDMEQWDDAVFETLPEWVQSKIKQSTQYQKEHPPAGTVDFPAIGQAPAVGTAPAANPIPAAAPTVQRAASVVGTQNPPNSAPVTASAAAPAPGGTVTPAAAQSAPTANSAPSSAPVTQSPTPAATGGATPINFADYAQASLFPGAPVTAQAQPTAQTSGGWPFS